MKFSAILAILSAAVISGVTAAPVPVADDPLSGLNAIGSALGSALGSAVGNGNGNGNGNAAGNGDGVSTMHAATPATMTDHCAER